MSSRLRIAALAALVAPLMALLIAGGNKGDGKSLSRFGQTRCVPGGPPTHVYRERPEEPSLRYVTRPVVIGCINLPSGRSFELVGYQLGGGGRTDLCIDHYEARTGETWGCASNQVLGGGAIDASSTHRSPGQPDVVAGALSKHVARVVVRSELRGRLRRGHAARLAIRDRALLGMIAVKRPFGRYLAELPDRARAVTAEALDARRRSLGLSFAEGVGGPVGEGRACYSRPRIARLRLLETPKASARARLELRVNYPSGFLRSAEATVSGDRRFEKVLRAQRARTRARRTLTLPIRLPRPGTIGIDVTVTGVPIAKACGVGAWPRRSAARTFVVRVRA